MDAVSKGTGLAVGFGNWIAAPPKRLVPFVLALTGLVCVCDWIASDETFVARAPVQLLENGDTPAYLQDRMGQAATALDGVLLGSGTPVGTFPALFGGHLPRGGAQDWAVSQEHGPGLSIVMTNMGEGKTEVALYMHATDASTPAGEPAGDGLFFGLPTMATADAMFARGEAFWEGTQATGRLAHSQAILHDFYAPTTLRPVGICGEDSQPARDGLTPADWFAGRHRGLLAPVTFGTCDQVLAGALAHKFLPVRLAGLAGKHVVLDEVHTYDPYQHRLLCRLLGWLGAYQCRVTLLSATLPRDRVAELAHAWSEGWHGVPAPAVLDAVRDALPPVLPYPSVVTVADTLKCTPVPAWRDFALNVQAHQFPAGPDEFAISTIELAQQLRAQAPQARIGIIVNTVDRAIRVYEGLRGQDLTRELLLHSRMASSQRTDRTAALHAAVGKTAPAGPVLMVATQVGEASLDLDLDVLLTDLAPMASIWQRTGRMWRHSENTGSGWTHPEHLAYRTGDPTVHVLVPVDDEGEFAGGFAALPYTAAELRKTWESPACLNRGATAVLHVPASMQPSVDAAHVSFADLAAAGAGVEGDAETRDVIADLASRLAKNAQADRTGADIRAIARTWDVADRPDPWGKQDPDWSGLTAPVLWNDGDGAVTRLQERIQAQILLYDPTGATNWAWHGDAASLTGGGVARNVLVAALGAVIPVSGRLAKALLSASGAAGPTDWNDLAPPLLRGLTPVPVTALTGIAAFDPELGLIRLETL